MDTIFALASSPGKSGVAVVRVSGPKAPDLGRQLIGDSLRLDMPTMELFVTMMDNILMMR